MDRRQREDLDRHITGNYGEDQLAEERPDIEVLVKVGIKRSRIDDLLCCALEGGSTYWATMTSVDEWPEGAKYGHEVPTRNGTLWVHYEGEQTAVNEHHLIRALVQMQSLYPKHWHDFMNENEDADTGDVFLQLCCFGEVVYG